MEDDDCIQLFNRMRRRPVLIDRFGLNMTIKSLCRKEHVREAFGCLGVGIKTGIMYDVITFSTLLDALIETNKFLEFEQFVEKVVRGKLCEPNIVMQNTVVKGFCRFGALKDAMIYYKIMEISDCKPDNFTYNTIMNCLCETDMLDLALVMSCTMFRKGIDPDVVTYNSFINCYLTLGHWDEADKVLKEMLEMGIHGSAITYTILIMAHCHEVILELSCGI
ncbi:putative tetratricopeptide-like helical domain superfamily [Helianthus anomalus]